MYFSYLYIYDFNLNISKYLIYMSNQNNDSLINFPIINKKRLIKDIVEIMQKPLTSHGIFYKHSDTNLSIGYAMLIGPKGTPYENGMYFFKFKFNANYPFEPPHLTYLTNGDRIRFNPNLYTNGKVCLSILNTWRGESWTSCQTISTILLTLITVLNDTPLLNEPGVKKSHNDFNNYNKIIEWSNINIAICRILNHKSFEIYRNMFLNDIIAHINNNKQHIINKIKNNIKIFKKPTNISTNIYFMNNINVNYMQMLITFNDILDKFLNKK